MHSLQHQTTGATEATLHPTLLARAHSLSAEHAALSATLSEAFSTATARRVGELSPIATALKSYQAAQSAVAELHSLLSSPSTDEELRSLAAEELESTEAQLSAQARVLKEALTPKHAFAHLPCLLEIRPGPGGMEGRHFADALVRMYRGYCASRGLPCTTVKYEVAEGEVGDMAVGSGGGVEMPVVEAVLEIGAEGAYGLFRGEAGMHRVQRVPGTEKNGRVHTSAVAVWVLPSFPENGGGAGEESDHNDPNSDFYIDPADVKSEKMRASGAGGQHVNKTESAVRLTHIPTGVVVSMQDQRSQHQNRLAAWRLLRSRVAAIRREERELAAKKLRESVLSSKQITRADKIRTYNYGQDRCTDHRSGIDVHNLPDVLSGGDQLEKVMVSVREWLAARDLEDIVAEEEQNSRKKQSRERLR